MCDVKGHHPLTELTLPIEIK